MDEVEYEYNVQEVVQFEGKPEMERLPFLWVRDEERNEARFGRLVEAAREGYPMEHIKALRIVKREVPREPEVVVLEEVWVRDV
jgi:hypothetical protein